MRDKCPRRIGYPIREPGNEVHIPTGEETNLKKRYEIRFLVVQAEVSRGFMQQLVILIALSYPVIQMPVLRAGADIGLGYPEETHLPRTKAFGDEAAKPPHLSWSLW
jgi:hypothetical protein